MIGRLLVFTATLIVATFVGGGTARADQLPCGFTTAVGKSWIVHVNGVSCANGKATVRHLTGLPGARAFLKAHKKGKVKAAYRLPSYRGMTCSLTYLPVVSQTNPGFSKLVLLCLDLHTGKAVGAETAT